MKRLIFFVSFLLMGFIGRAQQPSYINKKYDIDNSENFGPNGFLIDSGYLFISSIQHTPGSQVVVTIRTNFEGTVLSIDTVAYEPGVFYQTGYNGASVAPGNSGFITPLTFSLAAPNPYRSSAGFAKIGKNGDTIFTRRLKDTQTEKSYIWVCDTAENGNLLFGGHVRLNSEYYEDNSGLLIKTDSLGNTIWEKRFRHPGRFSDVATCLYVKDRGYLITCTDWTPQVHYYNGHPQYYWNPNAWVMLLDTAGNLLRERSEVSDTTIFQLIIDRDGGYMGWGYIDSVFKYGIHDYRSFPAYLIHIDTNFATTWKKVLVDSLTEWDPVKVIQTKDNGYLYAGYIYTRYTAATYGWALKLDKNKQVLWEHYYYSDSLYNCQIMDVKEKDNGDLLFCGFTRGQPQSASGTDMWVVTTDSMGCPAGDCLWPTDIEEPPLVGGTQSQPLKLYPNPGSDHFNIETDKAGNGELVGMDGRKTLHFKVRPGNNYVAVPPVFAAGMYLLRVRYEDGSAEMGKWVKQQ